MADVTDSYSPLAEEEAAQQMAFDDKELADHVVALGIGEEHNDWYFINVHGVTHDLSANEFTYSWVVAGALMEKCEAQCVEWDDLEPGHWRNVNHTSNTPRSIIKTCVGLLLTGVTPP